MLKIILPFLLAVSATAGTYTSDLLLYKPAARDTNYVAPFATGMDTLDAAIPDKRINKTAVFASSLTVVGPLTAQSSATICSTSDHAIMELNAGAAKSNYFYFKQAGTTVASIYRTHTPSLFRIDGNTSDLDGFTLQDFDYLVFKTYDANLGSQEGFRINDSSATFNDPSALDGFRHRFFVNGTAKINDYADIAGTMTVTGNAFSVGGSTLVVSGGTVGVFGQANRMLAPLSVNANLAGSAALGSPRLAIGKNSTLSQYTTIGFGYTEPGGYYPAEIGFYETGNANYTLGDLIFATRSTDPASPAPATEKMRILSGGNVGIGTTAPATKLQVVGGTTTVEGIAFNLGHSTYSYTSNIMTTYEEGTWVPNPVGFTLGAPATYTTSGSYTRIGRMVYVTGRMTGTGGTTIAGAANTAYIINLPFTAVSEDSALGLIWCPNDGTAKGQLSVGAGDRYLQVTGFTATGANQRINFSASYQTSE